MEILKYELYKIFSRRIVVILLIALSILVCIRYYFSDKMSESVRDIGKDDSITISSTFGDKNTYTKDGLINVLESLKEQGKEGTFKYKSLDEALKMKENLSAKWEGKTGGFGIIDVKDDWQSIIIALATILGISSIFASEYDKNTAPILLSSKNGKSKVLYSKIIVALSYGLIVYLVLVLLPDLVTLIIKGTEGGNNPIILHAWFRESLFSLNLKELYFKIQPFMLIGILSIVFLVTLISVCVKKTNSVILLSIFIIIALPLVYPQNKAGSFLNHYNFLSTISSIRLFEMYKPINIFGNIVMYHQLTFIIALILSVLFVLLTIIKGRKQQA